MPRRKDPSFELKKIVWDAAAKLGEDKLASIERELDRTLTKLRRDKESDFYEETPDRRTIKRIIEDIDKLSRELVLTLPKHMWTLRTDYEELKRINQRPAVVSDTEVRQDVEEERRIHREKLTAVLNRLLEEGLLYVQKVTDSNTGNPIYLEIRGEPGRDFTLPQLHGQMEKNLTTACEEHGNEFVFKCFLPHLKAEYTNVEFRMLSMIETGEPYQLLRALQTIANRGTFKGSCPICKDWK